MSAYLLLSKIKIQNANAMSSPLTVGFPAVTAWLGGVHALERRLRQKEDLSDLQFTGAAVACHSFRLQTYRGKRDHESFLILTGNPLGKNKDGKWDKTPFVPDARVHLTVSLLLEVTGITGKAEAPLLTTIAGEFPRMKLAGGDILGFTPPRGLLYIDQENVKTERAILRKLMPGYVLTERRDLMEERMKAGENSLDALLHFLSIEYHANRDDGGKVTGWTATKAEPGWLVPISVGFKGVAPLGKVAQQRDGNTPHRFAENLITLGEFKMPHHFERISDILWRYEYLADENIYRCINQRKERA